MIKVSKFNERITILKMTKKKNEFFEWVETYEPMTTIWCSIKQQYFREYVESVGTILENTMNFSIRYEQRFELDQSMRVRFKGNDYEIVTILEGSFDRDYTTIVAKRL